MFKDTGRRQDRKCQMEAHNLERVVMRIPEVPEERSDVVDEKSKFLDLHARGRARSDDRCLLKSLPAPGTPRHWLGPGVGMEEKEP